MFQSSPMPNQRARDQREPGDQRETESQTIINPPSLGWRIPLRTALTVPLVTVIAMGMVGIGGLSWISGRRAVFSLVRELNQQISKRVEDELETYLDLPAQINLLNGDNIRLGLLPDPAELNDADLTIWGQYLGQQMERFPQMGYLGLITNSGGLILAQRQPDGSRWLYRTTNAGAGEVTGVELGSSGDGSSALPVQLGFYDGRLWPWFETMSQSSQNTRSPLFGSFFAEEQYIILTGLPLLDDSGELQGILEASVSTEQIETVLAELDQSYPGQSLIVDGQGHLILGPGAELQVEEDSPSVRSLRLARDSSDPVISLIGQSLDQNVGSLTTVMERQSYRCQCDGDPHLIEVEPLAGLEDLNWYLVRGVAEAEILADMNHNTQRTLVLGGIIALGSLLVTMVIADRITRPIGLLSRQAQRLIDQANNSSYPVQDHDPLTVAPGPISEIQVLIQTLSAMTLAQRNQIKDFHDQEEFYRFILDTQTELICRYTPETQVRFVNQSYLNFFNDNHDHAIGKYWINELPALEQVKLREAFAKLTPTRPLNTVERTYPCPEGNHRWLNWIDQGIFDDSGTLTEILSVGRDITAQKKIESELKQVASQKDQLFTQVQKLNADLNVQVEIRTAEFQEALQIEAMLHSLSTHLLTSLDEVEILRTVVKQMVETLDTFSCVIGFFSKDQLYYKPRYEYSPALTSCLDRTYETQPTSYPSDFGILWEQYREGLYTHRCTFEPADNCWITLLNCPILDEGKLLGLISVDRSPDQVFRETEIQLVQQVANLCAVAIRQARLYQSAQTQVLELARLNRLKDDFVSTVSHELRSPLSNLRMALGMIKRTSVEEKRHQYYEVAMQECDRQIALVNDLLDMQRLELQGYTLQIEPIDLPTYLHQINCEFAPQALAKSQQWVVDPALSPGSLVVNSALDSRVEETNLFWTDTNCLGRILRELAHNAIKYTAPNGQIYLTAHPQDDGILFVCANSTEIPDTELSRLFEKFYRIPLSDRWKHGGTGLGLALVKQLIAQVQGHISVDSSQGWTYFRAWIPQGENRLASRQKD